MKRQFLTPGVDREHRAGIFDGETVVRRRGALGGARAHGVFGERRLRARDASAQVFRLGRDGLRRAREDGILERPADVKETPDCPRHRSRRRLHPESLAKVVDVHAGDLGGDAVLAAATRSGLHHRRPRDVASVPRLLERADVLFPRGEVHVAGRRNRNRAVKPLPAVQVHPLPLEHEVHVRVREVVRAVEKMETEPPTPDLPPEIRKLPRLLRVASQS